MSSNETQNELNKKALLVGICKSDNERQRTVNSLNELERLADTAGLITVDKVYQNKDKFDSAYYVGKGFVENLKTRMQEENIGFLLFDDELTPAQHSHLEKDFEIEVIDRTELILNIFYKHAQTSEARMQIRLAELKYELPRLKQIWTDYDRISGSSHSAGSGASRGGGEKQIDLDRSRIRREMYSIQRKLDRIITQKDTLAKKRADLKRICLVGYTNAGKSTLFNTLTNGDVLVEDKLFATLDSTCRPIYELREKGFLISDTVGFISKLPHNLVASFRATLKEAKDALLLLEVIDASDPDFRHQKSEVEKVLAEIEADKITVITVFNKIDALTQEQIMALTNEFKQAVFISAKTKLNIRTLLDEIENKCVLKHDYRLFLPYSEQKLLAKLHAIGDVKETHHLENGMKVVVNLDVNYRYVIDSFLLENHTD